MKNVWIIFFFFFVNISCSGSNCYRVLYNGSLIEERNYENGELKSIVAYNLSDTKDSIMYDGGIKCFHFLGNEYVDEDPFAFQKYYNSYFDKSLSQNLIYSTVESHVLLEDVLWSLASIDCEMALDSVRLSQNRIITEEASGYSIEYKKLDAQCQLYGLFQTYNTEKLESVKAIIKDGCLIKLLFVGEKTNKTVVFEYLNDCLYKVKICYYGRGVEDCLFSEEYCYIRKETKQTSFIRKQAE